MNMNADLVGKKVQISTINGVIYRGIVIDAVITINTNRSQINIPFKVIRKVKVIG